MIGKLPPVLTKLCNNFLKPSTKDVKGNFFTEIFKKINPFRSSSSKEENKKNIEFLSEEELKKLTTKNMNFLLKQATEERLIREQKKN